MRISDFICKVFPKANHMPTTDHRGGLKTAIDDIRRHMDTFGDWDYQYLFYQYLHLLDADEQEFIFLNSTFIPLSEGLIVIKLRFCLLVN